MKRREFLRMALACGVAPSALSLSGCDDLIRVLGESCPAGSDASSIINWTPDVLHPVSFGFQDLGPAEGAPVPLRIWYPSDQVFTEGGAASRAILKMCVVRWPVVLFLHGLPPVQRSNNQLCFLPDYYLRWTTLPAVLAKSGYVVVAPSTKAGLPLTENSQAAVDAIDVLDWVRGVRPIPSVLAKAKEGVSVLQGWEHAKWVDQQPGSTAIIGHSRGAVIAAFVLRARPNISSFVGLGGVFGIAPQLLQSIAGPKFFMWADLRADEDLESIGLWQNVATPRHVANYPGGHFDYLPPWPGCDFVRTCPPVESLAADLIALFIARHTPVRLSLADIPVSLDPPDVTLTPNQQFFGADNLSGLRQFASQAECSMRLRWDVPGSSDSRELSA
jgi:hypothetical protein